MCNTILNVIVVLRVGGTSVNCSFKVTEIIGEPGKTCHTFNYDIHLAHDFLNRYETAELCLALHSVNDNLA